jgi:hypothetical protein
MYLPLAAELEAYSPWHADSIATGHRTTAKRRRLQRWAPDLPMLTVTT